MKRAYRRWIRQIPWLHRQHRRFVNFDRVAGLSLLCFLCGFWVGVAAMLETHHDPFKDLDIVRNRPGISEWARRTFASVVAVPGHQLDGSFVFSDFESIADFSQWKTEASYLEVSKEYPSEGSHSMKISFHNKTRLSSVRMENYFNSRYAQSDWSGYKALAFYLYNPSESRERIILQIKDRRGKRYKEALVMDPERGTRFLIDLTGVRKEIDIHRIEHINFFVWDAPEEKDFYLDDLRLMPQTDGK